MTDITIFSTQTGQIRRNVSVANPFDVMLQCGDGEGYITGTFADATHYVDDYEAVPKPPRPSQFATFDYGTKQWVESAQEVAAAKASALHSLSDSVSAARRRFITSIPGQEMIYLAKQEEARRYLAESPAPVSLAAYPLIAAEVGITAPTAYQLAVIWLFMADAWTAAAAQIEGIRLNAASSIQAATTVSAALAALDQAKAALDQINP